MKKILLTLTVAVAFTLGMASCNNNKTAEEPECTTEQVETHECDHQCQHQCTCPDTACAAAHCEGCTDTTCCKPECCKKGDAECCKKGDAECCKKAHEGCCNKEAEADK